MPNKTLVAASGGFDPLHAGHIEYLEKAKALGDKLVVIINNDDFLMKKKGYVFMPFNDRVRIISSLRFVDEVMVSIDDDQTVSKSLKLLKPNIFAKGPHWTEEEMPEKQACKKLGIKIVENVGKKVFTSPKLLQRHTDKILSFSNRE